MLRKDSEWWSNGFTAEWWNDLSPEGRVAFLDELTDQQIESFAKDWRVWGRDNQLAPEGIWDTWLLLMGRGTGKTRTAVEATNDAIKAGVATRIAIVGQGEDDIRKVMIEGKSGFIQTAPKDFRPIWLPSRGTLEWPNGALGFVYSAQDTEGLRGPEFDWGWFDEPLAVPPEFRERAMDNLEFCLRLPPHPRLIITTTPKPHRWMREMKKRADDELHLPLSQRTIVMTRGSTTENQANLAPSYYRKIMKRYEGTNVGRQEIHAEVLGEEEGAIWTPKILDRTRVMSRVEWDGESRAAYHEAARRFSRQMDKVVIGVDPNTKTASNHAAGIVPCGRRDSDETRWCLGDWSATGMSPPEWAKVVMQCYDYFDADEIVVETNNGGEMIRALIVQAAHNMKVQMPRVVEVHAKRDKLMRATPVASLYELRRAGQFGETGHKEKPGPLYLMETQMCAIQDNHDPTGEDYDRVDALVWAMTRLGLNVDDDESGETGMTSFEKMAGA